jgi:predicted amidohydrolase YtcJ
MELLIRRARVWTDGAVRTGTDAIAIGGGRILAVGRESDLRPLAGATTDTLDAAGSSVTPGLVDAHLHLVQWAKAVGELPLADCASAAEVAARVARLAAQRPGTAPVIGRGWDANGWPEPPSRGALDRACAARPVLLHGRDFHALWVNGAALAACGVTRDTPDPDGGRIVRDAAGEPTGVLMEHAVRLCASLLDSAEAADAAAVEAALPRLHALGITGVHDFEGPAAQRVLREACGRGGTRLRVLMHLAHSGLDAAIELGLASGTGDDGFRIGAVKLFADGTLGSRTAALRAPYEGTDNSGMDLIPPAELRDLVARAMGAGLSVAIHAIGDRAVHSSLDAFEFAGAALPRLALPPRIEHVQLVDDADLPRFARLGVAASMQPSHAISDAALADRFWGSRVAHAYPWRELHDHGARLAFGSDAPVEPPDAADGLRAAVTREVPGRAQAFTPHQRVTLDVALTAYTEGPARLAGTWPRTGTLRPGAVADLVVWNSDLHATPPSRLGEAAPVATVIDGRVQWIAAARPATAGVAGGGAS